MMASQMMAEISLRSHTFRQHRFARKRKVSLQRNWLLLYSRTHSHSFVDFFSPSHVSDMMLSRTMQAPASRASLARPMVRPSARVSLRAVAVEKDGNGKAKAGTCTR